MRMMLLVVLPVLTGAHLIVLLWIVGPTALVSYFRPPLQCSHGMEFDCQTKHSINIRTTRRMLRGVVWLSVCGVGLMITNLSPQLPLTESCSSLLRTTSACIPRIPSLPYQYAWSLMSIATMGAASKMVQHLRKQSTAASSNRVYSHLLHFLWSHDARRPAVACWQRAVWPDSIPRLERQIGDVPIPWRNRCLYFVCSIPLLLVAALPDFLYGIGIVLYGVYVSLLCCCAQCCPSTYQCKTILR